jgi:Helix-turn-helix domain
VAGLLDPKGKLVTTAEAAELLRMSPRTLENMRVDGDGPRYHKLGPGRRAKVVYRIVDLDTWIAKFSRGSTSEEDGPEAPK